MFDTFVAKNAESSRQFLQGTCKNEAILAKIFQEPLKSCRKLVRIKRFLQDS